MYARVVSTENNPDKVSDAMSIWQNSVLPAARKQPGFKGITWLVNAGRNKAMSITLWETEADMMTGESSDYLKEQLAKFASVFESEPIVEHYEVMIKE